MTKISNLTINFQTFGLKIKIDGSAAKDRIRGFDVGLTEIEIDDLSPHDPVTFQDVLECVASRLDFHGIQLSFELGHVPDTGCRYLKAMSLTKRFGAQLPGGQGQLSHTEGTQVWNWGVTRAKKKKTISGTGKSIDNLLKVPVPELRTVSFTFGAPPPS